MFAISRAGQRVACAVVLAFGLSMTPLAGAAAQAPMAAPGLADDHQVLPRPRLPFRRAMTGTQP